MVLHTNFDQNFTKPSPPLFPTSQAGAKNKNQKYYKITCQSPRNRSVATKVFL